jgi:hypothetical protein
MIDGSSIIEIEQRLETAVNDLSKRVNAVAQARQVKEFVGEDRKNLLASFKVKHAEDNEADNAQETAARADPEYQKSLELIKTDYRKAEEHLASWEAAYCKFEAARSLLSMAKQQLPAAFRESGRQI